MVAAMNTLQLLEFGPFRAAGLVYRGKNEANEVPKLWDKLVPQICELAEPGTGYFGICRCIPGAEPGVFEYIACLQPKAGVTLPEGFVEVAIPRSVYAAYPVESLDKCKDGWMAAGAETAKLEKWAGYCGQDGCECAEHPCFEYYPPFYEGCGRFDVMIPIKRKE